MAQVGADTKGFTDGLTSAQKSLQQFSSTAAIAGVRASAAFAASFGAIGAFALKVGSDFELAFANIRKTVDGSEEDFANLEMVIRDTSKEFGIAATELADFARIGGQLGIKPDQLDEFTRSISRLSIAAAELDPELAAKALARLAALTGEGAGSIEKMANVVAKLGDSLPTTEDRILDFSVRMASFGSAVGLSSTEILGLSAGFSALVGGTERAATSVERFLGEMAIAVKDNGSELEAFAELAQSSLGDAIGGAEDFAALFSSEPLKAIEAVIGGMENLSAEGLAPLLAKFDELGIKGVRMLSTFAAGAKGADTLRQALAAAAKEAEEQTKLDKELAIQLDTVSRQFDRLKTAVVNVGIELFQAFRDEIMFLIDAAQVFVAGLMKLAEGIKAAGIVVQFAILAIVGLMGAFAGLLVVIGTVGGLVVGLSALLTTMATALGGTGIASTLAASGLVTYSAATGAATIATGGFASILGTLASGFLAVAAPALVVLGVGAALAEIFNDITIETNNLHPSIAKAAEELGFFGRIIEVGKIAVEALGEAYTVWRDASTTAVDVTKELAAEVGVTGKQFDTAAGIVRQMIGEYLEFVTATFLVVGAYEMLRASTLKSSLAQEEAAQALNRAQLAQSLATAQGISLAEAQALIAANTKLATDRLKEAAEENKKLADTGQLAATSMNEQIARFLEGANAADRFKSVQKALGIEEEVLAGLVEKNGQEFLRLAEIQIKAAEAAKKHADELKKLREQLQGGTVQAAEQNFKNFAQVVQESMAKSTQFTDQATIEMVKKLRELAKAAGVELPAQFSKLEKKADDLADKLQKDLDTKAAIDSFKALGVAAEEIKFDNMLTGLKGALAEGETFTKDKSAEIFNSIAAQADAAGMTIFEVMSKLRAEAEKSGDEALKEFVAFLNEAQNLAFQADIEVPISIGEKFNFNPSDMKLPGVDRTIGKVRPDTAAEKKAAKDLADDLKEVDDQIKESDESSRKFGESLQSLNAAMQIFGMSSDSTFGRILGGLNAAGKAGADFQSAMGDIEKIKLDPEKSFNSAEGINAGIALGSALVSGASAVWEATGEGGIAGALGGALAGAQLGAQVGEMLGPIGAAAGAAIGAGVGAAISLFRGKPEFKKIMEDVGKEWGVTISEELAKKIEATAEELDLTRLEATLLNIGDVIAEAGGVIEFGMEKATDAVGQLMNGIVDGSLPAAEAIEEIGTVFSEMAAETVKAGELADAQLLALVQRSRELGLEIPEITQFITDQLAQAAEGITKVIGSMTEIDGKKTFGGIQIASVEDAEAQAAIFSAAFFATVKEQGLLAAVDAFGPALDEMKAKLEAFGGEGINLSGLERFFNMAQNPEFRPLLEGVEGLTQGLAGLGNAGFLTADTFGAFQQQGQAAFDQLQEAGLNSKEALQQMAPFLQEALNASQMFGFDLDENTKKMIEQAEAAGIGFSTDPMMQVVDVLKLIAVELGVAGTALDGVGSSAAAAGATVDEALGGATDQIGDKYDELGNRATDAYREAAEGARQSAEEQKAATQKAAEETVKATEEATKETQLKWSETTEMVGSDYDIMTDKIMTDYGIVIEATAIAGEAVTGLGTDALMAASGFDEMAASARLAAEAAKSAKAASPGSGGDGGNGGPQGGQFGLTTTVNEPTTFIAGEAGEETVTIDPGGGGGQGGGPSVVVLQIDGKTIGKVLGDLSRTGDVRIHPSAVKDFG